MVVISLALVAAMTVMGLGLLLPNSLRIWMELRRREPDRERIVRINRVNIWLAGNAGRAANRNHAGDGKVRELKYSARLFELLGSMAGYARMAFRSHTHKFAA